MAPEERKSSKCQELRSCRTENTANWLKLLGCNRGLLRAAYVACRVRKFQSSYIELVHTVIMYENSSLTVKDTAYKFWRLEDLSVPSVVLQGVRLNVLRLAERSDGTKILQLTYCPSRWVWRSNLGKPHASWSLPERYYGHWPRMLWNKAVDPLRLFPCELRGCGRL